MKQFITLRLLHVETGNYMHPISIDTDEISNFGDNVICLKTQSIFDQRKTDNVFRVEETHDEIVEILETVCNVEK